ncbi:MAG: hypothetical protein ACC726_07635, partial [Chloroflexota bacterium]
TPWFCPGITIPKGVPLLVSTADQRRARVANTVLWQVLPGPSGEGISEDSQVRLLLPTRREGVATDILAAATVADAIRAVAPDLVLDKQAPGSASGAKPALNGDTSGTPDGTPAGLITEAVEPGVDLVISDGFREFARSGDGSEATVATGLDGSVWLFDQPNTNRMDFFQVGDPKSYNVPLREVNIGSQTDVEVGLDGQLWVAMQGRLLSFDGGSWKKHSQRWTRRDTKRVVSAVEIEPDSTVWAPSSRYSQSFLGRLDEDGSIISRYPRGIDRNKVDLDRRSFALAPDGTVWARYRDKRGADGFIRRRDGEWRVFAPFEPPQEIDALDVGADGTLWALLTLSDSDRLSVAPTLQRFAGDPVEGARGASVYSAADGLPPMALYRQLRAGPDGSVWLTPGQRNAETTVDRCDGLARFDGTTWTQYLRDTCIFAFDIAPDGTVWARGGAVGADTGTSGSVQTYRVRHETPVAEN